MNYLKHCNGISNDYLIVSSFGNYIFEEQLQNVEEHVEFIIKEKQNQRIVKTICSISY